MQGKQGYYWTRMVYFVVVLLATNKKGFVTSVPAEGDEVTTGSPDVHDYSDEAVDSEDYQDLQLDGELQDQTLQSGDRLQLRCRVSVVPKREIAYTWYHDNTKIEPNNDERISIKAREWGSRLQILTVYTADSGSYRCEASDGEKSVFSTAQLTVTFNLPPSGGSTDIDKEIFKGKCELYQGYACGEYLKGKYIYVESFQEQNQMEQQITAALGLVGDEKRVSEECAEYARPAFCHYVFPLCEKISDDDPGDVVVYEDEDYIYGGATNNNIDLETAEGTASAIRLCREDCELLKHDVCLKEFDTDDPMIQELVKTADCSRLPRTTATGAKCSRLGLKSVVDRTHVCYNDTGTKYMGVVSTVRSGATCKSWPSKMFMQHPELVGGHNFCRNPGNVMDHPWCYIDRDRINKEVCDIPKCKSSASSSSDLLIILIPCVSIPLLIGCIVVVMCVACKKSRGRDAKHIPGKKVEMKPLSVRKTDIPELPAGLVHFSLELGEGKYGKVYKAQIMSNMVYSPAEPVAVKTVAPGALQGQINEFQREMEMFADLQHTNVSCLKACVIQPTLRCMIFEYTSRVDLHELLTLHSPHSDIGGGKMSSSSSSHTSSSLEAGDFLHMAVQVACGLEYLAGQTFVHRDLAARNILVCNNNIMKISNLGVVRDCYLASYYRSPQGGHMLPVRWMAPESLNSNMFSEKSVVWSFGIMVWEMFSYGMQPYCGYSNHEVIDMISKGQTLACPDQCSSRIFSLMRECWSNDPNQRPTCRDIYAKLSGWEGASTTRMTSQLAQGIHRQLNNVIREGAQFQYSPPQGTVIDGFGQPYMASPPQPGPPHVSPASQPYYTSASTSSSGIIPHQPPSYPNYMQHPQAFAPAHHPQPQMHYARPYPDPASYPYKSSHTHSSSRSTDSCGSSARNQLHGPRGAQRSPQYQNPQQQQYQHQPIATRQNEFESFQNTPDSGVHSSRRGEEPAQHQHNTQEDKYHSSSSASPPPQPIRSRPGSGLVSANVGLRPPLAVYNNAQHGSSPTNGNGSGKPVVAPKPPLPPVEPNRPRGPTMGLNGRNRNHSNHPDDANEVRDRLNSSDLQRTPSSIHDLPEEQKQRDSAKSGGKAMSCDSGLPNDEPEPDAAENQPFITKQPNSKVSFKTNKTAIQIPSSSSSSTSGSTAVTADTRLTTS